MDEAVRATRSAISPRFAMSTDVIGLTVVVESDVVEVVDDVDLVVERKRAPTWEGVAGRKGTRRRRDVCFMDRIVDVWFCYES